MTYPAQQAVPDTGSVSNQPTKVEPAYTVREAARTLRISEQTLTRLIRNEQLPAFKIGKHWRIKESVMVALQNGEIEAA
jgi:excisionase family DNA binding protein